MLKKIKRAKKEVPFLQSCHSPPPLVLMVFYFRRCGAQRVRIDLILSRSKNWRPAEVLLLGTRPIEHVYNGTEVRHCPRR